MTMTEGEIRTIARQVVAELRPTLRRVVGDRTPAQYDRADTIAAAVAAAVTHALEPETDAAALRQAEREAKA